MKSNLKHDVWTSKYQLNGETEEQFFQRITDAFVGADNFNCTDPKRIAKLSAYGASRINKDRSVRFKQLFDNYKYIVPGGSVLAGVGSNKPVSLSNCFVTPTGDSIEQIFNTARDMSQIYKRRGGNGTDLSSIRPASAFVNNAAKSTGGVIPFMKLYSQVTNTIGQDGRRGALMLSLDINHPDSPEFVKIKQDLTQVTGANISVKLNKEFKAAVKNDGDYVLRWPCDLMDYNEPEDINIENIPYNKLVEVKPGIYVKLIRAKELWESIIQCAWNTAEPGILFWDTIVENDPAGVYPEFKPVSTNPCGEIPLSPYDSCRLIANNLYSLVENPFTKNADIDLNKAYVVFYEAQIIADILVDLEAQAAQRIIDNTTGSEKELWEKIKDIGLKGRRTGVGITALADMLAALGKKYNDIDYIGKIMKLKMQAELDASIDLACLNDPFPAYSVTNEYDNIQETDTEPTTGNNPFYQFLMEEFPTQFERMLQHGRRNISFSTIAPTGTISLLTDTSSGCEPVYSLAYTRRRKCNSGEIADFTDELGVGFKNYNVLHGKLQTWYDIYAVKNDLKELDLTEVSEDVLNDLVSKSPWYKQTAEEINPSERVKVQAVLQRFTTHSISSTVNVANDVTTDYIKTIYEDAWDSGCKGITVDR